MPIESFETWQSRLHSSAMLGSAPMGSSGRDTSEGPWHEVGLRDSRSILGFDSTTRTRDYSLGARQHRLGTSGSVELFSRAEDLIRSAREDAIFYRCMFGPAIKRQERIFYIIVALTFVLPPIGLVALLGQFDSTISWYTSGAMRSLTGKQRTMLKQLLMVEGLCYVGLVVGMLVYFNRRRL